MRFTKEHEWVKVDGETATVGITDYAQHALGDVVSVELPKIGAKVKQSASFALVDSMKASSDVYAPVSGEVIEVNKELTNSPQLINESPEEKGWIAKIKVENKAELDTLMTKEQYDEFIKGIKH